MIKLQTCYLDINSIGEFTDTGIVSWRAEVSALSNYDESAEKSSEVFNVGVSLTPPAAIRLI